MGQECSGLAKCVNGNVLGYKYSRMRSVWEDQGCFGIWGCLEEGGKANCGKDFQTTHLISPLLPV